MSNAKLSDLATGYLEAEGYDVQRRDAGLLHGTRAGLGDSTDDVFVWCEDASSLRGFTTRAQGMVRRFTEVADRFPQAKKYFVVPTLQGIPADFRRTVGSPYVGVRVLQPAQFFDTDFRWEANSAAPSASRSLADEGEMAEARRVQQPFTSDSRSGEDLLPELFSDLRGSEGAQVVFIVGPAGMGKTFLFQALFARLYRRFLDDKKAGTLSRRPIPLFPAAVRGSHQSSSVDGLLNDLLATDFARPLGQGTFEWRLLNGSALWLLDGLDEVIARDPDFFDYLLDLATRPAGGTLRVALFLRDSMLATNAGLRELLNGFAGLSHVYRLEPWSTDQQTSYFATQIGQGPAASLKLELEKSPDLRLLAGTPFYASVIVDEYRAGTLTATSTEEQLLEASLNRILDREYEKALFDATLLPKTELVEFLETLAIYDFQGGMRGIPVAEVRENAAILMPTNLSSEQESAFHAALVNLALFAQSSDRVRFAHEVLEQFLLGTAFRRVADKSHLLISRLSVSPVPQDWVTLKVAGEAFRRSMGDRLAAVAQDALARPVGFNNLVRMASFVEGSLTRIAELGYLDNADLSDIEFTAIDFSKRTMRGADLTNVRFKECDLREVRFDGSILSNTAFDTVSAGNLGGATFGDLSRFHSLITPDGSVLDSHTGVADWLSRHTSIKTSAVDPCDAALQLRHLFGKFVHEDGSGRRANNKRTALIRGARYGDPAATVEAAERIGFLVDTNRGYVNRADGEAYREMVEFRRGLAIGPLVRRVLDETCNRRGCQHVASLDR